MPEPRTRRRRPVVVAVLVAVALLAGGVFVATRSDNDDPTDNTGPPAGGPDETVAPSTVVAEIVHCPDGAELCIGMVTATSATEPVTALAWTAVETAAGSQGAEIVLIESDLPVDYGPTLQRLAADGFHVIVTVGFDLTEVTRSAARAYPDIHFVAVDQPTGVGPSNLAATTFASDEAGALAGTLAAMLTETSVVAAVLGSDLLPGSLLFAEGFEAGARAVNPDIATIVTYHPGDLALAANDPGWAAQVTGEALANGADVVVEGGGATGVGALRRAAEAEGTFCLGVVVDRSGLGADSCLVSSLVNRVDRAVAELITAHVEGTFPSGAYAGTVELAPFGPFAVQVPAEALALLPDL
ncbi:MAG: BMP family ABC transporter substrate-binding protein [Actinomycetia bacterium]|nr:BMP family ABC transporter substrate-binding protein [Actinomycetes bacterium]